MRTTRTLAAGVSTFVSFVDHNQFILWDGPNDLIVILPNGQSFQPIKRMIRQYETMGGLNPGQLEFISASGGPIDFETLKPSERIDISGVSPILPDPAGPLYVQKLGLSSGSLDFHFSDSGAFSGVKPYPSCSWVKLNIRSVTFGSGYLKLQGMLYSGVLTPNLKVYKGSDFTELPVEDLGGGDMGVKIYDNDTYYVETVGMYLLKTGPSGISGGVGEMYYTPGAPWIIR